MKLGRSHEADPILSSFNPEPTTAASVAVDSPLNEHAGQMKDAGVAVSSGFNDFRKCSSAAGTSWTCRILAVLLIFGAGALHVAYLTDNCPLDLAPDEAHYWDWSRHPLEWSYYSKGPLVAYLIRAGCVLAGDWSQRLVGSEMAAVRLPAVICGSLLLVSLYVLTCQVYRSERLALAAVGLALTLPPVAAGSSLMTIDAPYTCCWGWALVLGHHAIFGRSRWAWPAAGVVAGLGILAKYTMVIWFPSVALFLLLSVGHRRLLFQPGFWIMTAIAAGCCLPILIWNIEHSWVSLRHVGGLAGVNEPRLRWLGPLTFVGGQCGLLLGFWFVAWLAAMIAYRPGKESKAARCYLWCTSAVMFAVFLAFSFKTGGGELNWPITAYISGLVLTAGWLAGQLESTTAWYRRSLVASIVLTGSTGVALSMVMHRPDLVFEPLVRLSGPPTPEHPYPLRRFDPTCRLRGWQTLAKAIDQLRADLRRQNADPILATSSWALPGEIGFYCAGHPPVYSIGLAQGDRHSQYDLWRPNPLQDADAFQNRTFILVGYLTPNVVSAFDHIDRPLTVTHYERGQPIASWQVIVCHGFHGLKEVPGQSSAF